MGCRGIRVRRFLRIRGGVSWNQGQTVPDPNESGLVDFMLDYVIGDLYQVAALCIMFQ